MGLSKLYQNHVLANLAYLLVLALGWLAYQQLPKERAPDVLAQYASIQLAMPGVSAEDAERLLLAPVERMLSSKIKDIKHVNSNAQSGHVLVSILFDDLPKAVYEKRLTELRRELQALTQTELPKAAEPPDLYEGNLSADWFKILVYGPGEDENFRRQARRVKQDLQRLPGIARVMTKGLEDPELHVVFHTERLAGLGISPTALADTVKAYFRDIAAGIVEIDRREWLIRISGTEQAAAQLAELPIAAAQGKVRLGDLADITRSSKTVKLGARFRGQPAIAVMPFKQPGANTLELIDSIKAYIDERNRLSAATGIRLFLLIDESDQIRNAISVMEDHAWSGMLLVLFVAWLLLGYRLAFLTTLAVPFSLAGVFIALQAGDYSLNLSVLLGVIIVLGMLVDDAVVVIEAIGQQLRQGLASLPATVAALKEVWLPVTTSSLTTIATFMPLMLVKGYLGKLMGVVPQVVCLALLISIVQALWILPAHAVVTVRAEPVQNRRERMRLSLQRHYCRALLVALRRPKSMLLVLLGFFMLAGATVFWNWVPFNFLPKPPEHGFIVKLEMPNGTPSAKTLATVEEIERRVTPLFKTGELRASAIESGAIRKDGQFLYGHQYGDVWFSLTADGRDADSLLPAVRPLLKRIPGAVEVWIEGETSATGSGEKPVKLLISAPPGPELDGALAALQTILAQTPGVVDSRLNRLPGLPELTLHLDSAALQRAGIAPETVIRSIQLLAGGEIAGGFVDHDEPVGVRVRAEQTGRHDITAVLNQTVVRKDGARVPLGQLVFAETQVGTASIDHADYRQVLVMEAGLDQGHPDVLTANQTIEQAWLEVKDRYPGVEVSFTGQMETVQEGLQQLLQKFVLGLGLIFLIVGAQFQSYGIPLLVLMKIPIAFAGVILGLLISQQPVSLYTLYGGVALAGIAVNAAILMFAAAQERLKAGMSVLHAAVYAARRRLLPILITSLTTLVGLLPLAFSGDASSTQWQPVAGAIVWGVGFSTLLTLFMMPLLYWLTMRWALGKKV